MLMARDMRGDVDKFVESVKLALVTADPTTYLPMITGVPTPTEVPNDDFIDDDDGPVEWDFSNSEITPEMAMTILAEVNTETTFTTHLPEKV